MKVSYKWLQAYFDVSLPTPSILADLFTFHSFEVEGIEEDVIDVKILPDRAHYCLSHAGIAEEISVLTGLIRKDEKKERLGIIYGVDVPVSSSQSLVSGNAIPKVTIEDPLFCRRFTGRYVTNLGANTNSVSSAPSAWMGDFLSAVGSRAISPIVDATNFVMFDIGQPLHAFDADKIEGDIVIRAAKDGEKIVLLDGKEYTLTTEDHVIADAVGPLDIAGVKGGKRAEVSATTKNLLLTSANFNPTAVRRTSTRLNLRNEASKRFENEITPELAPLGMRNLSALIYTLFPKAEFGPVLDIYPTKAVQTIIELDPAYISTRLGISIPDTDIQKILERFGIAVTKMSAADTTAHGMGTPVALWKLTIPFHRLDLTIPEDIVEEVGRIHGYEHIKGTVPSTDKTPVVMPTFYCNQKIRSILAPLGFSEVYLHTLVPKGDIEVAYPLASDKAALRTTLTAGMAKCLEQNVHNADLLGLSAIQIFEIGKVFNKVARKSGGAEKTGNTTSAEVSEESLVLSLGCSQVKKIKGVDGKLLINKAIEKLSADLGVDIPIKSLLSTGSNAVCEIGLEPIIAHLIKKGIPTTYDARTPAQSTMVIFKPFSSYPFIVRDIAIFVPEQNDSGSGAESSQGSQGEVWAEIERGIIDGQAKELLARHSLFDTFKKDGKISYAFRLIFQSMDRTLTDTETNAIMEKIYARIAAKNWQVR